MSRGSKGTRPPRNPQSEPVAPGGPDAGLPGPADNGASEENAETGTTVATEEEPAQVQLTIKGSDKSARAAAKRFGEGDAPKHLPVVTPANDPEAQDDSSGADPIAALLADGKNMVIVTRQTPRNVRDPRNGAKIPTNVRLPGKYTCPTSIAAIEEQVFSEHWGATYKCTIHPDTSSGENTILGHFKIEHPDPKAPPYIEGVTDIEEDPTPPDARGAAGTSDPTLHETDQLVKLREDAERRIERARLRKEAMQMEQEAKRLEAELENGGRPPAPPSGESDEVRKLREKIVEQERQLAEKKVDDRFNKMEGSISELTKAIASLVSGGGKKDDGESMVMKMMQMAQQHSKDMIALIQEKQKPASSPDGDLDKFLDRVTKLQGITGTTPNKGGSGRLSDVESRLIDIAWDKLNGGGGDDTGESGDMYEDAIKLAIKEFAPVAKTFVEKKMAQETAATGGQPLTQETIQRIYSEAGAAAARKVQEDLLSQGIKLVSDANGKLHALPAPKSGSNPNVPPRAPASRVVSTTKTHEGVVKKVALQPHDLSKKPTPSVSAAPAKASVDAPPKGDDVPKCGIFPMLGENGGELQIPFPVRPGELKYDRKFSVNFILDGIRSEIRQGHPQKAETDSKAESYVVGDAIEYLDDEILDSILEIDSGMKLEALLAPWGDSAKIVEIKSAGDDEVVASYLRKLVMTIQREWQREKDAAAHS